MGQQEERGVGQRVGRQRTVGADRHALDEDQCDLVGDHVAHGPARQGQELAHRGILGRPAEPQADPVAVHGHHHDGSHGEHTRGRAEAEQQLHAGGVLDEREAQPVEGFGIGDGPDRRGRLLQPVDHARGEKEDRRHEQVVDDRREHRRAEAASGVEQRGAEAHERVAHDLRGEHAQQGRGQLPLLGVARADEQPHHPRCSEPQHGTEHHGGHQRQRDDRVDGRGRLLVVDAVVDAVVALDGVVDGASGLAGAVVSVSVVSVSVVDVRATRPGSSPADGPSARREPDEQGDERGRQHPADDELVDEVRGVVRRQVGVGRIEIPRTLKAHSRTTPVMRDSRVPTAITPPARSSVGPGVPASLTARPVRRGGRPDGVRRRPAGPGGGRARGGAATIRRAPGPTPR